MPMISLCTKLKVLRLTLIAWRCEVYDAAGVLNNLPKGLTSLSCSGFSLYVSKERDVRPLSSLRDLQVSNLNSNANPAYGYEKVEKSFLQKWYGRILQKLQKAFQYLERCFQQPGWAHELWLLDHDKAQYLSLNVPKYVGLQFPRLGITVSGRNGLCCINSKKL